MVALNFLEEQSVCEQRHAPAQGTVMNEVGASRYLIAFSRKELTTSLLCL